MSRLSPTVAFGIVSLALVLISYLAGADLPASLSPQGCRMSWMSPSYVMQSGLDKSWSPLADRYSLWLYREVGWEGTPVRVFCFECYETRAECRWDAGERCASAVHPRQRRVFAPGAIN